jgi:uncharacterized protein (DUF2336 family)
LCVVVADTSGRGPDLSVAFKAREILELARSRTAVDRERLLDAIVDLCASSGADESTVSAPVQALINSIFMSLVAEAERDIRRRLAEKLADAPWAPSALINVLALDDIEIARPIIAASPVLRDHDLVRLLVESTVEHQIEVARRPKLGPPVVAAILEQGEPAVLSALAGNLDVTLASADVARLVETSRRVAALRAPLARRPELTEALAQQLYLWVGQSLRQSLVMRFRLDAALLDARLAEAVQEAHGAIPGEPDGLVAMAGDAARQDMEQRLIAKLQSGGQLRPGYLLRALREQRLSLFEGALATLGGFKPEQLRKAIDSERPELLALACAAIGIDRSVFPTILGLVRELNGGRPDGGPEGARRAINAFGPFPPDVAGAAFRQAMVSV